MQQIINVIGLSAQVIHGASYQNELFTDASNVIISKGTINKHFKQISTIAFRNVENITQHICSCILFVPNLNQQISVVGEYLSICCWHNW